MLTKPTVKIGSRHSELNQNDITVQITWRAKHDQLSGNPLRSFPGSEIPAKNVFQIETEH
jgi:hypothetical protein